MDDVRGKADGFAQRLGVARRGTPRSAARFRPQKTEQVAYSKQPPGASSGHSASRMRALLRARSRATSVLRRSHLPSGCRRTMPDAVHGTSARMRSNGAAVPPAGRIAGVARDDPHADAASRRRARFSRTRASRASSLSSADELDVGESRRDAWSCRPARRTRRARACRRATQSSGAASCAPEVLHRERAVGDSRAAR